MQSTAKQKASDDPRDFVVVPSDQVGVAPSDAEITDLLRAAARRSETGGNAASDPPPSAAVPAVDATFRATAVNENVVRRSSFGRQLLRVTAALVLAVALGVGWQVFGYAAKETVEEWLPKLSLATSLPLDKLWLSAQSQPAEPAAVEEPPAPAPTASAVPAAAESATGPTIASPADTTQQALQSMARELAGANQEIETLKASIAELKASQQQMIRERTADQAAKAKLAAPPPRPQAAHKPPPTYSPSATPPGQASRPVSSYASTQTVVSPPPQAAVQSSMPRQGEPPPPVPLQPQTEQPGLASVPRPPMPLTQ